MKSEVRNFTRIDQKEYQSMLPFPSGEPPKIVENKFGQVKVDLLIGKMLDENNFVCSCILYDHDQLYGEYIKRFPIKEDDKLEFKIIGYFNIVADELPNSSYDETSYLIKTTERLEQLGFELVK